MELGTHFVASGWPWSWVPKACSHYRLLLPQGRPQVPWGVTPNLKPKSARALHDCRFLQVPRMVAPWVRWSPPSHCHCMPPSHTPCALHVNGPSQRPQPLLEEGAPSDQLLDPQVSPIPSAAGLTKALLITLPPRPLPREKGGSSPTVPPQTNSWIRKSVPLQTSRWALLITVPPLRPPLLLLPLLLQSD